MDLRFVIAVAVLMAFGCADKEPAESAVPVRLKMRVVRGDWASPFVIQCDIEVVSEAGLDGWVVGAAGVERRAALNGEDQSGVEELAGFVQESGAATHLPLSKRNTAMFAWHSVEVGNFSDYVRYTQQFRHVSNNVVVLSTGWIQVKSLPRDQPRGR